MASSVNLRIRIRIPVSHILSLFLAVSVSRKHPVRTEASPLHADCLPVLLIWPSARRVMSSQRATRIIATYFSLARPQQVVRISQSGHGRNLPRHTGMARDSHALRRSLYEDYTFFPPTLGVATGLSATR